MLLLRALLAADGEHVALELDLDVAVRDARDLRRHLDLVVGLGDVDLRTELAPIGRRAGAEEVLEQLVHLAPQQRQRVRPL